VFRVWIGREKARSRNSLKRKSDSYFLLSAERCPVTARPKGAERTRGTRKESDDVVCGGVVQLFSRPPDVFEATFFDRLHSDPVQNATE